MTLETYAPMLAVSWETPFDDERWAFEEKLDGVRAIISIHDESARIRSRNDNDVASSYPELAFLETLGDGTILDGEIIAYDEEGGALVRAPTGPDAPHGPISDHGQSCCLRPSGAQW